MGSNQRSAVTKKAPIKVAVISQTNPLVSAEYQPVPYESAINPNRAVKRKTTGVIP
jgi:hypothetical protein